MSNAVSSFLLVGIKKEEPNSEDDCVLGRHKVNTPVRPNRLRRSSRPIPQPELESIKSDCGNSGDEWQSATSSSLSNEAKTTLLLPSTASTLPTDQLNTADSLSSSIDVLTTEEVFTPNTSEITYPKNEPEDSSCSRRTDESEIERHRQRACVCGACAAVFPQEQDLTKHIDAVHGGLCSYPCEICGRMFWGLADLRMHIDFLHKRKCVCGRCGAIFSQESDLTKHIDAVHGDLREVLCEFCGEDFGQRSELETHLKAAHREPRKYVCRPCGKAFSTKRSRKAHFDSAHKGTKSHECGICGQVFPGKDQMNMHIRTVHKERLSGFRHLYGMSESARQSEKLRQFACEFCGKTFTLKSSMIRHIVTIHEGSEACECEICGKAISHVRYMKRHIQSVHKGVSVAGVVQSFRRRVT